MTITRHTVSVRHEPSWWLRSQLGAISRRWDSEGARACRHIIADAGVGSVRVPGITALWATDRVLCSDCSFEMRLTGAQDRECDRCREHISDGETIAGIIYDTEFAGRRLFIMFGLCATCLDREAIE